jgi:crotonobetainyl-CoA:carnitine CoA-transferase CaiB-like acyl-CoA transferase
VRSDKEFDNLVRSIGSPELAVDDRFSTARARWANDVDLIAALTARFKDKPASEWEAVLSAVDVGCVEANMNGQPAFNSFDPVLLETGLTVAIDHPMFGSLVRAAPPVSFSETPGRVAPPCMRGEHNRSILTELGYTEKGIAQLEADGVIFPPG